MVEEPLVNAPDRGFGPLRGSNLVAANAEHLAVKHVSMPRAGRQCDVLRLGPNSTPSATTDFTAPAQRVADTARRMRARRSTRLTAEVTVTTIPPRCPCSTGSCTTPVVVVTEHESFRMREAQQRGGGRRRTA
jgi:hypothetical protein